MASSLSLLLLTVFCFGTVIARSMPRCPDKTPMSNFDFQAFHGTWIWVLVTNNAHKQGATCLRNIIQDRDNGTTAFFTKDVERGESEYRTLEGNIMPAQENGTDGTMQLDIPSRGSMWHVRYLVLGTEYENYAVTWACWVNHEGALVSNVYVMSRSGTCSDDTRATVEGILQANQFDINELVAVQQTDCPASSE